MGNGTKYGTYLKNCRLAANLSLREAARRIGVTHVHLAEVERGVRGPFPKERWSTVVAAVPTASLDDLERLTALTRGIQLNLADAAPQYQDLGMALARRIERQDLDQDQLARVLKILTGEDDGHE